MLKVIFNKKETIFTSKLDLNLRKELVKWYIWSIAFYGDETFAFRKVDEKWAWPIFREMKKYDLESIRKEIYYVL